MGTLWPTCAAFYLRMQQGAARSGVPAPPPGPAVNARPGEKVWRQPRPFKSHCFIDKNDLGSRRIY